MAVLQEERNSLLAENDVLTDRANQLDTFDDPSTPSGRKHSQLQQQLETLQEENFRSFTCCCSVVSRLITDMTSNACVHVHASGWRQLKMTTASTVRSWRSS